MPAIYVPIGDETPPSDMMRSASVNINKCPHIEPRNGRDLRLRGLEQMSEAACLVPRPSAPEPLGSSVVRKGVRLWLEGNATREDWEERL